MVLAPETGFTGNDFMRSEAVKDMAKQATHVIVVTDSIKFQQKGVVNLLNTQDISYVYTDSHIPQDVESYLHQMGINVIKTQ